MCLCVVYVWDISCFSYFVIQQFCCIMFICIAFSLYECMKTNILLFPVQGCHMLNCNSVNSFFLLQLPLFLNNQYLILPFNSVYMNNVVLISVVTIVWIYESRFYSWQGQGFSCSLLLPYWALLRAWWSNQGMKLTIQLSLVPQLKMHRGIHPLFHTSSLILKHEGQL
jgi:hypothetical protein